MYKLIFFPIIVSLIVHGIKILIDLSKKRFSWTKVFGYGGMPSSHAALVASLATAVYLVDGAKVAFAISVVLAMIVIRDAVGLRSYLTNHARIINKLIKDLPDEEEYKYPILQERIAHTWLQLLVGAILGVFLTLLFF